MHFIVQLRAAEMNVYQIHAELEQRNVWMALTVILVTVNQVTLER